MFLFAIGTPGLALDGTNTARPRAYSTATAPHYGYMEYLPAGYADGSGHYPLVIFLHGIGERGNGTTDLARVEANGPPKQIKNGRDFPAIVISPQAPPSGVGWFWEGYIVNLINHCKTTYRVDPDRVYVTGLSAGGGTAWYLGDKYPGTVSAIAVICGATELNQTISQGGGLRRLPVWAFHNQDDTIVYPSKSQRNLNAIVKAATGLTTDVLADRPAFPGDATSSTAFTAGYTSGGWQWSAGVVNRSPNYPMYTLYAKGGHDSWGKTYDNQTFWDWLFAQRNHAPTISTVSNRTVATGSSTGALAVTINDVDMHPDYVVLTRASSNVTAVPLANVVLGGSGGARTVTVTGAHAGTSTITLTVSDGIRRVDKAFMVTVGTGANTPPAISPIANQSVTSGLATAALAFTVSDAETSAGNLTLTAESTNTALVPLAKITFAGTGGARTVTVASTAGQTGQSTIRIRVSDGSLTASTTFVVAVAPSVNIAPYISPIAAQTIISGNATAALAFMVSDAETPAGSLTLTAESSTLTVVPLAKIVFGGAGGSRTVTVTPPAGQTGQSTIRIRVSDGVLTASKTFVLTVEAPASSVDLLINFQPAVSANPAHALPDNGKPYGNRGTGYSYGWNQDVQAGTRDRNDALSVDQAHDTLIYTPAGAQWEIALPNGSYSVRVVAGDPIFANGIYEFFIEGVVAIAGSPSPGERWLDQFVTVTVSDGRLTLTQGASALYGKLCFLEILSLTAIG